MTPSPRDPANEIRRSDVVVAGRMAHFAEAGQGPALIVAAGLGLSARFYEPTLRAMARVGVRLVVPDLPGFGATRGPWTGMTVPQLASWLLAFADALHLGRPTWLGHSVGCQVALAIAAAHPDRAGALALAAPTGAPQQHRLVRQLLALPRAALREPLGLLYAVGRDYLRVLPTTYIGTWARAGNDYPLDIAPLVRCPALILTGHGDPVVPPSFVQALRERLPRAQIVEIAGGNHGLPRDAAGPFAAEVARFVRSVAGQAEAPTG